MTQRLRTAIALVAALAAAGVANADDAVFTIRASTMQGASVGATLVHGGEFCFLFSCSGSSGSVLEGEVGLGGAKAAVGMGIADRTGGAGLLTLKAAVFRSWTESYVTPANSVFVGPELEFASSWGLTLGVFKRVDASGWRFSAGLVRAF
jgi:hypothetical protein